MEAYDYRTPPGYGDTFFIYAFDADSSGVGLVSGLDAFNQRVNINNGDFVLRWFRGLDTLGNAGTQIQIRDYLQTPFFSNPISPNLPSLMTPLLGTGWPVLPEKVYPNNGYVGFDLYGALPVSTQPGQLAFGGVRRRKGYKNDPQESFFSYYEKPYQIQTTVTVPAGWSVTSGGFKVVVPVTDYEFEMRRIDGVQVGGGGTAATRFVGDDNSMILFTAVTPGVAGNSIRILGLFSGDPFPALQALSVTVSGTDITIHPQTDGTGSPINTVAQLIAQVAATPAAAALVVASATSGSLGEIGWGQIPDPAQLFGGTGGVGGTGSYCGLDPGQFKILLLDTNQVAVSNVPLLFSNIFHVPQPAVIPGSPAATAAAQPKNFWPTPPMLYRVNANIQFYIYVTSSTPLAADVTFDIVFTGVRRYPCK